MAFKRLIRFVASDGKTYYGEPLISSPEELHQQIEQQSLKAKILKSVGPWPAFENDDELREATSVKRILGPLTPETVPIIRCVGLNYLKHIQEGGRNPPPYPSIFIKPSTSTADWDGDIAIPAIAQDSNLDYEGELAVIISKDAKNVTEENALDYVLGYITANDLSVRKWQRDPAYAGGVPQWCFSKGFDAFCPMGPMIVSTSVLGAADSLALMTTVNGEVRQDSNTSDMLFGVKKIVSFCSQGTTLQKGSVILTGTPEGVALGMAHPKWLQNGDVVEVSIQGIGTITNTLIYE